jgi:NAD-reducing hydrogenase large subunit
LAEKERQEFMQLGQGGFIHASLAYHWARMIEMLHAAEGIKELLLDDVTMGNDLVTEGVKGREGIGVIEAPRGTLFHHYRIDEDDKIEMANLIVSTTNNNQAMNESIRQVAQHYLDGHTLTEGLLNHLEVAVRAYDPCLSCATHALGKMPLHVELLNTQGEQIDCLVKSSQGEINRLV